jgi:hypothetical protein
MRAFCLGCLQGQDSAIADGLTGGRGGQDVSMPAQQARPAAWADEIRPGCDLVHSPPARTVRRSARRQEADAVRGSA